MRRINGAADENGLKHNREYAEHLKNLGEAFEELDAKSMKAVTGSDFYSTGLYMPGTCLLQPALYIRGLADGLQSKVAFYENTPALSMEKQGQDWQVKTPQGKISTPKIILAVNGHAESFGFFKGRLMHVFTYASMTESKTSDQMKALGGERRWGITPSDPMGSTVRRISGIGGDRIVVRNRWSFDPSMEVSTARIERYGRDQDKGFRRRFPMLKDLKMDYRWSGRLCLSYNSAPAFGEVDDGIIAACVRTASARLKAHFQALPPRNGVAGTLILQMNFLPPPSRKTPPKPIAWLGAKATSHGASLKADQRFDLFKKIGLRLC